MMKIPCQKAAAVIALTVLLNSVPVTLQAEIYQWRDAEGRLHFSDSPPATMTTEEAGAATVELQPISSYDTPEAHKREWHYVPSAGSNGNSALVRESNRQALLKQQQKQQARCDKARARYRKVSQSLASDIEAARGLRDKKNDLRKQITELCH